MKINKSKKRGMTLVETMMSLSLTLVVFTVGVSLFASGMGMWYRGEARIQTESGSQFAIRKVATLLRSSMAITVDGDGNGVVYRMPSVDASGTFLSPVTWDNVGRHIYLSGTNLISHVDGGTDTILCDHVSGTDPLSNGAYRLFTAGPGTITRSLTVMLVSKQSAYQATNGVYGRHRETIFLRNVPQLTK